MALTLIDMKETAALTGKHHLYIRRMVKAGKFPPPVRIVEDRTRLYFQKTEVETWAKAHAAWKDATAKRAARVHASGKGRKARARAVSGGRGGMGTGPDSGDDLLALQARVSDALAQLARADAEAVKIQGMVKALGGRVLALSGRVAALESVEPSPVVLPVDAGMPSEADKVAMRERLRAGTLTGIEANKTDRYRAGRTFRRETADVK